MTRPAVRTLASIVAVVTGIVITSACGRAKSGSPVTARNLLLVTIDSLRADHVGAYGYSRAHTEFIDLVASSGVAFEHAYTAAPITLPSHATILTGRYPPGHGVRDNGMRLSEKVPTLATELKARGFQTGAFVAAFPLDHQFGLDRGFDVYSDHLQRDASGHASNERPASQVVDDAIKWIAGRTSSSPRFFAWIHVFEPHAPYGNPVDRRPVLDRYDDEIAAADRELMRAWRSLGSAAADTAVIVAGDHGEAFGEHGEYSHSIFVYDTTLRVPLAISGPGIHHRIPVSSPVTLADLAPTAMRLLGFELKDVDGVDLSPAFAGGDLAARDLYAESFAPLIEFGWAPLRSVRSDSWKAIIAPRPELYNVARDAGERDNVYDAMPDVARRLTARADRYASETLDANAAAPSGATDRLRALGDSTPSRPAATAGRPDPKDRREVAARIAQITSGELSGAALVSALEGLVRDDPRNGQAHLRLAYAYLAAGDCRRAEPEFRATLTAGLSTADAYMGLAGCLGQRGDVGQADEALQQARRLEPGNPVILANIGMLKASRGDLSGAIETLKAALAADPALLDARFNLALTYAKAGRQQDAVRMAEELLQRLPPNTPQRAEVERLLAALRQAR